VECDRTTFTERLPAVVDEFANGLTLVGGTPYQWEANGNLVNHGASAKGHTKAMATRCDLFEFDAGQQALRQLDPARTALTPLGQCDYNVITSLRR
jgi:hypothetical protein